MKDFISKFAFGGLISIGIGTAKASNSVYTTPEDIPDIPTDRDVFFGPAMRKTPGDLKENVLGSIALWVDVDNMNRPRWTIPPTYAVMSGHGWHCYWFLNEPTLNTGAIETVNKMLAEDLKGDLGCWNVNRVLRVPGTMNLKEPSAPVPVEIVVDNEGLVYSLSDFNILSSLSDKTRHKIATGDSRGYRSRSERDWAILVDLVTAGADDGLIYKLFEHQPCGDKHRNDDNPNYLKHSLERIRSKPLEQLEAQTTTQVVKEGIVERPDGYYVPLRKGMRRVSTFTLDPLILLDGSSFETEDGVVCDVKHDTFVWKDKVFSRDAFNSVSKMQKSTLVAAWQWLGRDEDVRELLPFLLEKLKEKGLPRVSATKMLGLHNIAGKWYFLGNDQVLSAEDIWYGYEGPLAWMTTKTEHPKLDLNIYDDVDIQSFGNLVPMLNEPGVIWPMIGWYTAAVLKPWIETQNYRFPILNVSGTRGSGKTSLIQRVFMPLMGQVNPNSYDSGTTKFVTLALLGSSNSIPIAFSEFRVDAVQRFLRFVLLAYDTGHDPRGRADLTTQDFPLQAPFSLDGEDLIDDAAARERIVVAKLHPSTIEEGSDPYVAYKELQEEGMPRVAGELIQRILRSEYMWPELLQEARLEVFRAFPGKLPDRVRNNHIVTYFGMRLWSHITNTPTPGAEVMHNSITAVYDMKAGRSRTLCDEMVEYVINKAHSGMSMFKYDVIDGVFWFQFAPAYDDWVQARRRMGRGTLEKDSMKTQLMEAPYYNTQKMVKQVWMYGVDLTQAAQSGLDVPSIMNSREIRVSF